MIELRGADDLARLSRALKAAGDKDLQKRLSRAISDAMRPVRAALPRSALAKLPRRGGLAAQVAASRTRIQRRNSGRAVGVRLRVQSDDNIRRIDKGTVRHPTFGHGPWVNQAVPGGWFTEPTEAARPVFAAAVDKAMQEIVAEIDRRE